MFPPDTTWYQWSNVSKCSIHCQHSWFFFFAGTELSGWNLHNFIIIGMLITSLFTQILKIISSPWLVPAVQPSYYGKLRLRKSHDRLYVWRHFRFKHFENKRRKLYAVVLKLRSHSYRKTSGNSLSNSLPVWKMLPLRRSIKISEERI